jgi:replicative DNA helicase
MAAPSLTIADATRAPVSSEWIRTAAQATRDDARQVLVVLDSIHTWAGSLAVATDEYTRLGAGLDALRQLAAELDAPVLYIAERNRASMQAGGLSAGAGNRGIEYGAEDVWALDREENAKLPSGVMEYRVNLTVSKNRNGTVGKQIPLLFHGAYQRFREAE